MAFHVPQRAILAIMSFFGIFNSYTMRTCLSFAITKMVNHKNQRFVHNANQHYRIMVYDNASHSHRGLAPIDGHTTFEWSEGTQGMVLAAFYWGYIVSHIPGGVLAEKFGGKYVFSGGLLFSAVFTVLTPFLVHLGGKTAMIIARILIGFGAGTTFPALSTLLAAWIPKAERSTYTTITLSGVQAGMVFGNVLSGILLDAFSGWESVFYFFGGIACVWAIAFMFLCSADPQTHPFITENEKEYLLKTIGRLKRDENLPPTPWMMILNNIPSIVIIIAQFGHDWLLFIMITYMPKYLNDVLKISLKNNGIYSSIPYVLMWIANISAGYTCDLMSERGCDLSFLRKLFAGLASYPPSFLLVLVPYVEANVLAVVALFSLAMGFVGMWNAGVKVNTIELSPNYAGSLTALVNGLGAVSGAIEPLIAGLLTPHASLNEWRTVFWLSLVIVGIVTTGFVIWASAEVQAFDSPGTKKRNSESV